jgi:integrase
MARRANQAKLDSQTARRRLAPQHGVYWNLLSKGCSLGYRRSTATKAGMWYAKYSATKDAVADALGQVRFQTTIGVADDVAPADGATLLSYEQARARANEWFPVAAHKLTGVTPQHGDYTVTDACRDYLTSLEGRSRSLYETNAMINRNVAPLMGATAVQRLTRARIEKWLRQLVEVPRRKPRNGLDPASEEAVRRRKDTANRNLTVLKAALNRSLADGKVACTGLAWKQVRPFKDVGQTRTRFLSDLDARKLVAACLDDFKLLVQGALFSGARYSELTRLLVFDFDPSSSTLLVAHSKPGKPRRIYLDAEAANFFNDACAGKSAAQHIFELGGAPWKEDDAQGRMAEAAKVAGIEPLTFHELRHTAASRWARLGLSLAEVAAQLGHADVRMTQRYAHLCQQTLADKVRALPAMGIYDVRETDMKLPVQ